MDKKIKVSVFVAGQRFNILTEKSEKYVLDIASEIDARINSLVFSQNMSRERAAVLTALDYADDSELDKENIAAVKEQIKDYLHEIERLQDNSAKVIGDYNLLKAEYERLIEDRRSAENAQQALEESQKQIDALEKQLREKDEALAAFEDTKAALADSQTQVAALQEELCAVKEQMNAPVQQQPDTEPEEIPLPEEADMPQEKPITAEDDLFFEPEEEIPVKPDKKKKNRHEHNHVNPYQQKAKQKDKGYTQQRQYSFFDIEEDK